MKRYRTLLPLLLAIGVAAMPAIASAKLYITSKTLIPLPEQRFQYCSRYNESSFACDDRVGAPLDTLYFVELRDFTKGCAVVATLENPAPFKFVWHVHVYNGGITCTENWSNGNTVHIERK